MGTYDAWPKFPEGSAADFSPLVGGGTCRSKSICRRQLTAMNEKKTIQYVTTNTTRAPESLVSVQYFVCHFLFATMTGADGLSLLPPRLLDDGSVVLLVPVTRHQKAT